MAIVSGTPGNRLTGPGGLDGGKTGGDVAGLGEAAGAGLASTIFSASCTFGLGMPFRLGNLIKGACGRTT